MWSFISNFATFSTTAAAAATGAASVSPSVASRTTSPGSAVVSPQQVTQPVVVSLSAATLKQVNASSIPRTSSRSRLPQDLLSEHSGISDCDMLSDYDFELIDSNVSDWVEIRKSTEKDGATNPTKPKPLYSAVAKSSNGLQASPSRGPIVSTRSTRKHRKQARNRKYKTHLRELEVSQARRLGHMNA